MALLWRNVLRTPVEDYPFAKLMQPYPRTTVQTAATDQVWKAANAPNALPDALQGATPNRDNFPLELEFANPADCFATPSRQFSEPGQDRRDECLVFQRPQQSFR